MPTDGSMVSASAGLTSTYNYQGTVGLVDANTPLVTFANANAIAFSRYKGSGNHNDAVNWTPNQEIGPGRNARLAGGQKGLFLLVRRDDTLELRRFDSGRFGAPTTIPGSESAAADVAFAQDPDGALHVSWPSEGGLKRLYSDDAGATWRSARDPATAAATNLRIAVGADHGGVAVFNDGASILMQRFGAPAPPPPPVPQPVARIAISPARPCMGEPVIFDARGSSVDATVGIGSVHWDFGGHARPAEGLVANARFDGVPTEVLVGSWAPRLGVVLRRDPVPVTLTLRDGRGSTAIAQHTLEFAEDRRAVSQNTKSDVRWDNDKDGYTLRYPPVPECAGRGGTAPRVLLPKRGSAWLGGAAVRVLMRCPEGRSCTGGLTVVTDRPAGRARIAAHRRTVLARTVFTGAPGTTARLKVPLTRTGRRQLKHRRPRTITVTVQTFAPNARTTKVTRTLTLTKGG